MFKKSTFLSLLLACLCVFQVAKADNQTYTVTTDASSGAGSLEAAFNEIQTYVAMSPDFSGSDVFTINIAPSLAGANITITTYLNISGLANVKVIGPTTACANRTTITNGTGGIYMFVANYAPGGDFGISITFQNLIFDGDVLSMANGSTEFDRVKATFSNCEMKNANNSIQLGSYTELDCQDVYVHDMGIAIDAQYHPTKTRLVNSTFSNNFAGAGISVGTGSSEVTNCTFNGNLFGLAYVNQPNGVSILKNNTLTQNFIGLYAINAAGSIQLSNNLIASNIVAGYSVRATPHPTITSLGGNICSDGTLSAQLTGLKDQSNVPYATTSLSFKDGFCVPTFTHTKGSVPYNAGVLVSATPSTDVWKSKRLSKPDVGAFELYEAECADAEYSVNVPTPTVTPERLVICKGDNVQLTAKGCNGQVYWNGCEIEGGGIQVPNMQKTTTFQCFCLIDGKRSASIQPITIVVNDPAVVPSITANKTNPCVIDPVVLTATGCNGTTYWSDGQMGTNITSFVVAKTLFTARCEVQGCPSVNSQSLAVTPKDGVTVLSQSTSVCSGETVSLSSSGCTGSVYWTVNGLNGKYGSTYSFKPEMAGTAKVLAICTTDGCKVPNRSNPTEIMVKQSPFVSLTSNSPVASGATIEMKALQNYSGYAWKGPSSFTSTLQNPSIAAASKAKQGLYTVTITDGTNNCSNTGQIFIQVTGGSSRFGVSEDGSEAAIKIFPNPTEKYSKIFVYLLEPSDIALRLIDSRGNIVSEQKYEEAKTTHELEVNTENWQVGLYLVEARSGKGERMVKKLIKVE